LDNDVETCDENAGEDKNPEISSQELEPTELPVDKPSRANVLVAFTTSPNFPKPEQMWIANSMIS
jgi:hypothetical protein